jgi:GTP-binding protein Era
LLAVSGLRDWEAIIPISATSRIQLDTLTNELLRLLPDSAAPLYPADAVTDEGLEDRIAEYVREAVLEGVQDELPHSLAVTIDDIIERDDKELVEVYANLFVERDSQKAIVIGHAGTRLRDIGAKARPPIEALVGKQVFLSIRVKVAKDWQRDPKQLGRLGF